MRDDEPSVVRAWAWLLAQDGAPMDTAAKGALALAQLHTHRSNAGLCARLRPALHGSDYDAGLRRQHAHRR